MRISRAVYRQVYMRLVAFSFFFYEQTFSELLQASNTKCFCVIIWRIYTVDCFRKTPHLRYLKLFPICLCYLQLGEYWILMGIKLSISHKRSHPKVFYWKKCLKTFTKLTGKHLCRILFLIKLQACIYSYYVIPTMLFLLKISAHGLVNNFEIPLINL